MVPNLAIRLLISQPQLDPHVYYQPLLMLTLLLQTDVLPAESLFFKNHNIKINSTAI